MNPELNNQNGEVTKEKHPLFQHTPVLKYLAMFLFILLPFIAGWIGYTYAPEKVVEVEKVESIEQDVIPEADFQKLENKPEESIKIYTLGEYETLDLEEGKYYVRLPEPLVVRGTVSLEMVDGEYVRAGHPFEVELDTESVNKLPEVFFRDSSNKRKRIQLGGYTQSDFDEGSLVEITFDTYVHRTTRSDNLDSVEVMKIKLAE